MDDGQIQVLCILAVMMGTILAAFWKRTGHGMFTSDVRRELKKERQWLRRGEYNAAMVKGRQNLELLLKSVADEVGIEIDNTASAAAGPKGGGGKNGGGKNSRRPDRNTGKRRGRKSSKPMTNQEFCRWLGEKGYLDRVSRWELNEIRIIGNKAVHENFDSRDEAWNQYNYLEDLLRTFSAQNWDRPERGKKKQ